MPGPRGAAGTPRTRGWRGGGLAIPRAGAETDSRKPSERSAEGRRPVGGRGPPALAGDVALTPPRGCPAAARTFLPELVRFLAGAAGLGRFRGGPWRAGAEEDEGPTRVRRAQGQGCVFLLRAGPGKERAWLA